MNFYLRALKHLFNLFKIPDSELLEKKTLKTLQVLTKTLSKDKCYSELTESHKRRYYYYKIKISSSTKLDQDSQN